MDRNARLLPTTGVAMLLLWTTLVLITRTAGVPIPWSEDSLVNATYPLDKYVCIADDLMFREGDIVPPISPCHQCVCRPPNVDCLLTPCERRLDCRMLQLADQCCPQYQCECEHNGRIYHNGEQLEAQDSSSCEVCYCRGGDIVCTPILCFTRHDCEPEMVPGSCCPKYDHCHPMGVDVIVRNSTKGWSPSPTTSSLPPTSSSPGLHTSATAGVSYETSASNRYDLLGEASPSVQGSTPSTTDNSIETKADGTENSTDRPIENTTYSQYETTTYSPHVTTTDILNETTTGDSPIETTTNSPHETTTDIPNVTTTNSQIETTTDIPNETTTDSLVETTTDIPNVAQTDSPHETTTDVPNVTPTDIPIETIKSFSILRETEEDYYTESLPTSFTDEGHDENSDSSDVAGFATSSEASRQPSTENGVEDTTTTLDNSTGTIEDHEEVTLVQRKTTASPLFDLATERTTLHSEGSTNSLFTKRETTSKQSEDREKETTIRLDMDAQESGYQLDRQGIGSSETATDSTEFQNNFSFETSQDPWSDSIPNGPESTLSGNNYFEFGTTEYSRDATEHAEGDKEESNTNPTTSSEESQEITHASGVQTIGDGPPTESRNLLAPNLTSTDGSLPQGVDSGLLVADRTEEPWEHHRPTQMVTDEIQYFTTLNPFKEHSEGENLFSTSPKPPTSFLNTDETLSTRFNKLGETEHTISQSKPSVNSETDTPSSVHPTERTDSEGITESVLNNTTISIGYTESGETTTGEVKLGEGVSQSETTLPENTEKSTDDVQSITPTKDIGSLESDNERMANRSEEANVTDESAPITTAGTKAESETTVNYGTELNSNSTSHQLQDTLITVTPTDQPLDEHTVEISSYQSPETSSDNSQPANEQPTTLNGSHDLPTTASDHDNVPLPIFKLSEEMANHQMVLEIHHITTAPGNEDSAEDTTFTNKNPEDKGVIDAPNKHPTTEVTEQVTIDISISPTTSINNEQAQDTQTTTDLLNVEGEHTTTAGDVLESATDSLELQGAIATISPELDVKTNNETSNEDTPLEIDALKQSPDVGDTALEPVTESEATKVPRDTETTSVETVTTSLTSQDVEEERTTEAGETNDNVRDEQTERLTESPQVETTTDVPAASEDVTQPTSTDKEEFGSPVTSSEADSNSSPEDYTVPSETSALKDSSVSRQNESIAIGTGNSDGEQTTQVVMDLRNDVNDTTTDPTVYETNTERDTTTQEPQTETNDKLLTTLIDVTTESPVSTEVTTESISPLTSLPASHHETSSEIEDSLQFQSNKTDVENTSQPEYESATEIEQHLTFQSNKTKDPANNHTVNGTTNVDFMHSLPPGWLKDEETEVNNTTEGHEGEQSTTQVHDREESSTTESSTSQDENNITPKINDAGTTHHPADNSQPEESIYTRLQREDAEEMEKYDLETLQNFFKNLYIQDDHEDASSSS